MTRRGKTKRMERILEIKVNQANKLNFTRIITTFTGPGKIVAKVLAP